MLFCYCMYSSKNTFLDYNICTFVLIFLKTQHTLAGSLSLLPTIRGSAWLLVAVLLYVYIHAA